MTYLVLSSLAVTALALLTFAPLLRWQTRAHTRERQEWAQERRDLNDRLAHAAGNPWTPPPVQERQPWDDDPGRVPELVADPDQEPY